MFVNSCLFKVCFVWILAFVFFFGLCNDFSFSFRVKMNNLQQTHTHTTHKRELRILQCPVLSKIEKKKRKKSLCYHKCFKENMEFRIFPSPINRTAVAQKLFRTDTLYFLFLSPGGFLKWIGHRKRRRSLIFPCWRHQHLTLHTTNCDVPTAFELPTPSAPLWNVTTTKKNQPILLQ